MTSKRQVKELLTGAAFQTRCLGVEVRVHYFYGLRKFGINVFTNHDRGSLHPLTVWTFAIYRDEAIEAAKKIAKSW